jgi:hypothetical protein
MSTPLVQIIEPDGTLRYDCGQDIAVRVALHRRNGTKRCPVELLHQGTPLLATDSDLRNLRDIESLLRHATTLLSSVPWHEILTAVAKALPDKVQAPWTPVGKSLSKYTIERKTYLWYPWIPQGEPMSIEGDPNVGKTSLLIKILAHLTSGKAFPTLFAEHPEADFGPCKVLLFTYEDDPNTTLHPRLVLNGGNPDLVEIIEGKCDPETGDVCPMTLQDLPQLEHLLTQHRPIMVCFDPLQSFLGPGIDMNRATETRPVLDAIRNLCKTHGCTPCYVRHNGKTQRTKALHAALGSIDITGNMRSSLVLYLDPDNPQRRILAHGKKNGRPAPSLNLTFVGTEFEVETDAGTLTIEEVRIDWDGMSDLTADDLNARESAHGNDTDEANSALDQAREFLRTVLADAPVLVDKLREAARHAGVSWTTLKRAKDKERIKARRVPQENLPSNKWSWEWYDPQRHSTQA